VLTTVSTSRRRRASWAREKQGVPVTGVLSSFSITSPLTRRWKTLSVREQASWCDQNEELDQSGPIEMMQDAMISFIHGR
jgi:hypothetical protein